MKIPMKLTVMLTFTSKHFIRNAQYTSVINLRHSQCIAAYLIFCQKVAHRFSVMSCSTISIHSTFISVTFPCQSPFICKPLARTCISNMRVTCVLLEGCFCVTLELLESCTWVTHYFLKNCSRVTHMQPVSTRYLVAKLYRNQLLL